MTLRQYVIVMFLGTLLSWGAWGVVVATLQPGTAGWIGFSLFYLSLYAALVGSFALLGLAVRLYLLRFDVVFRQVTIAFRQAFSFALVVVAALFLSSRELLTWWNILLLIAALTLLEFAYLVRTRRVPPLK